MRRLVSVLAAVVLGLLMTAGPAAADPAGPTNYQSVVTGIEAPEGAAEGLEVEVLGGDAFLVLRAPDGVEVEVPGYDDEPYVRIGPDGLVEVNQRAPTHWYNEDRYGAEVPPAADVEATPVWREVADDGAYAWHDHRIHWMSPSPPDQVDTSAREPQEVTDWEIPVRLDGEPAAIRGELTWVPGPPPWAAIAWVVAGIVVAGLLVRRARLAPALLAVVVAIAAAAAGAATVVGQPPGADGDPLLLILPALTLVAGLLALWLRRGAVEALRTRLLGAAVSVPLLVWATLQVGALTRPVVPGSVSVGLLRGVVAAALGVAAAALLEAGRAALGAVGGSLDEEPDD